MGPGQWDSERREKMVDLGTEPVTVQAESGTPEPIPASQSKIIIAACVTVLASLMGLAGVTVTQVQQDNLTNLLVALAPLAATLVTGIVTIWARRKSIPAPIKGSPADPQVVQLKLLERAKKASLQNDLDNYSRGSQGRKGRR
jgi:hypothetical protein